MEEASSVKLSVAELAGKFKSHPLPMPKTDERKPVRMSPPCSLPLHDQMESESEKEKPSVTPQPPPKSKLKNSPLFEKLQANPILSPSILLNSARSPETKHQAAPFCPIIICSPQSPTLRPPQQHDEVPISFEQPAEGTTLPNFNKSRVRLSFKRRPPTRQHRKSAGEEGVPDTPDENRSPCDLHSPDNSPDRNGNTQDALDVPPEETHASQEDSTPPITVQDTELHVFGLWKETGVPGEIPGKQANSMHTDLRRESNPDPSAQSCEHTAVLISLALLSICCQSRKKEAARVSQVLSCIEKERKKNPLISALTKFRLKLLYLKRLWRDTCVTPTADFRVRGH